MIEINDSLINRQLSNIEISEIADISEANEGLDAERILIAKPIKEIGKSIRIVIKKGLPFMTNIKMDKIYIDQTKAIELLGFLRELRQKLKTIIETDSNTASIGFTFKQEFQPHLNNMLNALERRRGQITDQFSDIKDRIKRALTHLSTDKESRTISELNAIIRHLENPIHRYRSYLSFEAVGQVEDTIIGIQAEIKRQASL